MVALVFMILAIVATLAIVGFGIYKSVTIVKSPTPKAIKYPFEVKRLIYLSIASGFSTLLIFVLLCLYHQYPMHAGEWVELILGSLIFGSSLAAATYAFIIHYYGKEIPDLLDKWLFRSVLIGFVSSIIGLVLFTNGFANHLDYPLVNGISFSVGFTYPGGVKPSLAWYAICILSGAVLVYFICDHRFYVEYGKHGILESTFLVAFPMGIVGGRLGYVIGNWNRGDGVASFAYRVSHGQWWAPLAVWEGGLTIISGALVGIIAGALWFIWRNKKYSLWLAADIVVPCILIAQAVGRWGNFFNGEVHGFEVSREAWRWFLPRMVTNNMEYSEALGKASSGMIYMPLFYIEFLSNLAGYFIIRFAVGKGLRKYLELSDLACAYIIWYGLTRVIMEPLRDTHYNMGNDNYWSWIWSMVFVIAGSFAIFVNHLVRYLINRKKVEYKNTNLLASCIASIALLAASLAFIVVGAIKMGGVKTNTLVFDDYNVGLLLLIIGLGLACITGCAIIYLCRGFKNKHETI